MDLRNISELVLVSSLARHKRQQSQTQSQNGQGGSQLQSQTQDAPGGQQHQTQSQGQHLEPVATPAVNIPVSDNRHDNVVPVQSGGQQLAPQGGEQQFAPQGGQHLAPQGGEQQYAPQPQGGEQQYAPQPQGGQQQHAPQGNEQQYAPQTENRNQPSYPQPQGNYQPGFSPFGFGAFGPGGLFDNYFDKTWNNLGIFKGFPQQGFGFPQQGFGFPQQGFGGVGFGGKF